MTPPKKRKKVGEHEVTGTFPIRHLKWDWHHPHPGPAHVGKDSVQCRHGIKSQVPWHLSHLLNVSIHASEKMFKVIPSEVIFLLKTKKMELKLSWALSLGNKGTWLLGPVLLGLLQVLYSLPFMTGSYGLAWKPISTFVYQHSHI